MNRRCIHGLYLLTLVLVIALSASPAMAKKKKGNAGCECNINTSPVEFPANPTDCQFHLFSWLMFFDMVEDNTFLTAARDIDLFAPPGVIPPKEWSFKAQPPHLTPLSKNVQAGSHHPLFSQTNTEVLYGLRSSTHRLYGPRCVAYPTISSSPSSCSYTTLNLRRNAKNVPAIA